LQKFLLAYDSSCGPCIRFKRFVDLLDSSDRFDFKSLVLADKEGFLDSIPKPMRHLSFHLITTDGTVISGGEAIPTLIGLLPLGGFILKFVTAVPGGLLSIGFVYAVLSRLHNAGACQYDLD
jgi:predicted DCC family thiol-disulfide oxidoreductase YuxK